MTAHNLDPSTFSQPKNNTIVGSLIEEDSKVYTVRGLLI